MSDLDDTRRELAAERPRRYFDLECRRLTNMRGDEFVKRYDKDGFITSCKRRWFQAPKDIRDQIRQEYKLEPGSPAHREAMQAGVESLEARSTER